MKRIIRNSAECLKCGDKIESTHVHHFQWCSCGNIAVDGGKEYLKRVGDIHGTNSKDTSISEMILKCIIMSGVAGAGKSTWIAGNVFDRHKLVFSADNFFSRNGEYKFDPKLLGQAHDDCLRQFTEACIGGHDLKVKGDLKLQEGLQSVVEPPTLVVDNTNTTIEEINPYYRIAHAYGYEVELVTLHVEPKLASERGTHNVPEHACSNMAVRIAGRKFPPHWEIKQRNFTWDVQYKYFRDY